MSLKAYFPRAKYLALPWVVGNAVHFFLLGDESGSHFKRVKSVLKD